MAKPPPVGIWLKLEEVSMGTVEAVNKRNNPQCGIYIGRPSMFGNPLRIGPDGDRTQVTEKYRQWLLLELNKNQELREAPRGLDPKSL